MKKYAIVLSLFIIVMNILSGCRAETKKLDKDASLQAQLNDVRAKLTEMDALREKENETMMELEEAKKKLEETQKELKDSKNLENELKRYKDLILSITQMKNIDFEIIPHTKKELANETIVYVKEIPKDLSQQSLYLLKLSIEFSANSSDRISFWTDKNKAEIYATGNYDSNEGTNGWSGFEDRFGLISKVGNDYHLQHYNNSDDSEYLDFGKYTIPGF